MRSSLPPLLSQFFFLEFSVLRHLGILGWLGFTEPWRFCFPGLTKIGLASSLVGRFAESCTRNVRGKEVADQEDNMGLAKTLDVNNRQDTTRRSHTTLQHLQKNNHGLCFFLLCLFIWDSFLGREQGDDLWAFLFFPGVGNIQGSLESEPQHTTQTEQDEAARRREKGQKEKEKSTKENGTTRPRQPPRCLQRHHSSALGRNPFHLSKEHTTIRMFMVGTKGARDAPEKKKEQQNTPAWLHATTPPRRARAGHSFVTT